MYTIGIDIGGTIIKAGLLDRKSLLATSAIETQSGHELMKNMGLFAKMTSQLLEQANANISNVIGIGVSFPGLVDSVKNRVLSTNKKYDDAIGFDWIKWADDTWKLPLFLENDARMALLGEWQYGAGKGYENIVMVTLGTGVGSAVLIEGKLLKGKHFQAGNLGGHFTVDHRGNICTCGNKGCMEAEASSWSLPGLITNHPSFSSSALNKEKLLDFEALFRNAAANDTVATDILEHCFSVWSAGLISMIHAFDPEIIILGGGIMQSSEIILPGLQKQINRYAWTPWGKVRLIKAQHINTAALYGADYMVRYGLMGR